MMVDAEGKCAICGWKHEDEDPHHAWSPGEIDVWVVLCPDQKRRYLIRATESAARVCAERAAILCRALLPDAAQSADRCPGGTHTVHKVGRADPGYAGLFEEDGYSEHHNERVLAEYRTVLAEYRTGRQLESAEEKP